MIDVAVYDLVIRKGWKHQAFPLSGTFTAPVDGVYFLNGVAGGASGRVGADSADRAGGGSGESVSMMPVYLSAGTAVSITIAAGGTGDGGSGGNTIIGPYLTLYGAGKAATPSLNYVGGGELTVNGSYRDSGLLYATYNLSGSCKKIGARGQSSNATTALDGYADFLAGVKGGTYMWGGAGSKYATGGAGNASGAGVAGGIGAGGGSGTSAAGAGGAGYVEIMWQE